jgi:cystathionine gamma-synthase
MESFLALRGLRTLPLRMERASASALELAGRLRRHPAVTRVRYPGLASDTWHSRARQVLDWFGAMVACELRGGAPQAAAVCEAVRVWTHASSLGGVESLIEHRFLPIGDGRLPEGLIRLSVGCEEPEDLWDDLDAALRASF